MIADFGWKESKWYLILFWLLWSVLHKYDYQRDKKIHHCYSKWLIICLQFKCTGWGLNSLMEENPNFGDLKFGSTDFQTHKRRAESVGKSQTSVELVPTESRRDRIYICFGLIYFHFQVATSSLNMHQY